MTDVVAVIHPVWQARLARGLVDAFADGAFTLQLRTPRELASEVDIDQPADGPVTVGPDRPLLWLSTADGAGGTTPDERFLAAETMAACRSIAMLTRSPVLNRPSPTSATGTLPFSPALAVRRVRQLLPVDAVRPERFSSAPPRDESEIWDFGAGRSSYQIVDGEAGPFRHRRRITGGRLVEVRLVGTRVVGARPVSDAAVEASCRIAEFYGLDLVTVWWLADGDELTLSKVDSSSWDGVLGPSAGRVAAAIRSWLAGQPVLPSAATPA